MSKAPFYRLLNNGCIRWRTVGYKMLGRLKKLQESRARPAHDGRRIELLGLAFFHATHNMTLDFKVLTLAYRDGKTLLHLSMMVPNRSCFFWNFCLYCNPSPQNLTV